MPFSKGDKTMYLTLFYFCITINFIISILILYILIQFYRNYFNLYYSVKIVKAILPHTSTTFFLPIFFCFTSSFDCTENNKSLYSDNLKCYTLTAHPGSFVCEQSLNLHWSKSATTSEKVSSIPSSMSSTPISRSPGVSIIQAPFSRRKSSR